jgi:hypothetical protein
VLIWCVYNWHESCYITITKGKTMNQYGVNQSGLSNSPSMRSRIQDECEGVKGISTATRVPAIPEIISSTAGSLQELHQVITIIEDRLTIISRSNDEKCPVPSSELNPMRDTIMSRLNDNHEMVSHAIVRLRTIINLLEV